MLSERDRRDEILDTAAVLLASSGIRTSLKDIGDACGILPGSLYHHFDSKDAIIVELVRRYRRELDEVASSAVALLDDPERSTPERVIDLGEAIAACAVRNRAALLLTLYEPPATASDELVELARQTPERVTGAMAAVLESARGTNAIRSDLDPSLLAERICQSMLHIGVGSFHRSQAAMRLPTLKCEVFLYGVLAESASDAQLDDSPARHAADASIAKWSTMEETDRDSMLRSTARTEFAKRGFEATTMRDIARAADLSTGTLYRSYRSKDDLLMAIMGTFATSFAEAWDSVLTSRAGVAEKLDSLLWVNIKLLERFHEEFRIQLAWMRQSPPETVDLGLHLGEYVGRLQDLLRDGMADGSLADRGAPLATSARSMYEMLLTPDGIIATAGPQGALFLARNSVLRGALRVA